MIAVYTHLIYNHSMTTIFIYALKDPRDGLIKYVGQTKDLKERLKKHNCDFRNNTPKTAWLKKLKAERLKPELIVLQEVDGDNWKDAEIYWIAKLKANGMKLKNITVGGEGRKGPVSNETRKKLSIAGKGRTLSDEHKKRLREFHLGRRQTDEAKAKISKANLGRKHTADSLKKMSEARKGVPKTAEHRKKISEGNKGKVFSKETRNKMSIAKAGWKPSKELTEIQRKKCSGEGNGRARLTEKQVKEIRNRYANGEGLSVLGRAFNILPSHVQRIVRREIWRNI